MSRFHREHARTTDPEESHQSSAQAEILANEHCRIVLRTLEIAVGEPLAVEQIEALCPLTKWQISRRMSDLKRRNLIEDSGQKHRNSNGRLAAKWQKAVPQFTLDGGGA